MVRSLCHSPPPFIRCVVAAALAMPLLAFANSHTFIDHKVKQGDTLEHLATEFYGDARLWTELQKYNRVPNPKRLQPGSILHIPTKYLPMQSAEVSFVQGQASVNTSGSDATPEIPLKAGQKLNEGAEIKVAPDSFVTVKLADGSVVRIQAQSDVQLQQLRRKGRSGSLQSVIEMHQGSVNATVGTEPDPARRFEVRTPRATTSVRGTSFDVSLQGDGTALSSVTHGRVAVQGRDQKGSTGSSTQIDQGQGIAVSSQGEVGSAQSLLPSPDLSRIPETLEDANFLSFDLPPIQQASAYQVQVARDASMTEVLRSGTFATSQVRMKIIDDGNYYVAARAIDGQALPGMPAQRAIRVKTQPVPPLYQQPAPGATTSRTSGALQCTRVSGAQSYRIQVATDASAFANPLLDTVAQGDCSAALASLATGSYVWRAASIRQAADGSPDQGPFSVPQAFKVADNPASLDVSAVRTNEEIPGIHLQWPGEAAQTYQLQLASSDDFANVIADEQLDKPSWAVTDLRPGTYYVRIKTRDTVTGLESPFSAAREVRAAAEVRSGYGLPLTSSDGEPLRRR